MGGFFTTVEGLLQQLRDNFSKIGQVSFETGDSSKLQHAGEDENEDAKKELTAEEKQKAIQASMGSVRTLKDVINDIDELKTGTKPFTLVLDDPMASIYIQNPKAHLEPPHNVDTQLTREEYTRTWEQDEELGLHDMDVGDHPVAVTEQTGDKFATTNWGQNTATASATGNQPSS